MAKRKKKLTANKNAVAARHDVFVEDYIANGGNITKAAIQAGYAIKTAAAQGSRLLKRVNISDAIKKRQEELREKYELTTDALIEELSKIVHADPRKMFNKDGGVKDPKDWPDGMATVVAGFETKTTRTGEKTTTTITKVKFWDKNSAIEKAMKFLGMFKKDNAQKQGALSGLPREVLKEIVERLKYLNRQQIGR